MTIDTGKALQLLDDEYLVIRRGAKRGQVAAYAFSPNKVWLKAEPGNAWAYEIIARHRGVHLKKDCENGRCEACLRGFDRAA